MDKPLNIPPSKKFKGLKVYCYQCGTTVGGVCKDTGKPISSCKFGDKHRFKVVLHVPGTKNERVTKILDTRELDEAIEQAIEFKKQVKAGSHEGKNESAKKESIEQKEELQKEKRQTIEVKEESKPQSLVKAMAKYVGFLNNDPEIVPDFMKKERSKGHLDDVERTFKYFVLCLKANNYDAGSLGVNQIDKIMIGKFHDFILKEMDLSNRSYNKAMTIFTSFYNYMNDEGYQITNPFLSIPRKPTQTDVKIITKEEYEGLLGIIQKPELGISKLSTGEEKNLYKPWMKDAVELGLFTGRRNEEIVQMKWKDIVEDERGVPLYIHIQDFKVNRQKGREGDNLKYIEVPITQELSDLLEHLGYENYKKSDKYILATDEKMERDTIRRFMTRSFSHYYKQLNTGRNLSYKCLRKTYITQLSGFMGIDNAKLITKHSGTKVMEQHYLDKRYIAMTAKEFKLFDDKKEERQKELKNIRKSDNGISLER